MQVLERLSLASKKAIAMKVMGLSTAHEVMQGIVGMAGIVSNNNRKRGKASTNKEQRLNDLDVVVGWALKHRINLVNIEKALAGDGIVRLSMDNIKDR